ncbi:MAG: hypothetical protein Q8J74_06825 [Candidatus Didemnitutus sp.]|nr:hypothetical protein [Candidatus Didemnitutus sp.]
MNSFLPVHPRLRFWGDVSHALFLAASEAARAVARAGRRRDTSPPARGHALHPGGETPLWNELVRRTRPHLVRRGSKAQLARVLGLPRQRLQDCLKSRKALLDAERTLLLYCWVVAREQGHDLGTPPPGSL